MAVAEVRAHAEPCEPHEARPLLGDVRRRVQGDRFPDLALVPGVEALLSEPVRCCVAALDLEPERPVACVDGGVVEQARVQQGGAPYGSGAVLPARDLRGVEVGPDAVVRDRLVLDGAHAPTRGRVARAVLLGHLEDQL